MKYCTRCGGELLKQSATKFVCTQCKSELFRNPKGAVGLLLFDEDGQVILGRRAIDPKKGTLDQLGGFLDYGETFEDALYRELEEETGLNKNDVTDVHYVGSTHELYHWQGEEEPVVSVFFSVTLKTNKKPVAQDDVAALESFPIHSIPKKDVGWDGLIEMIEKVKNKD